MNFYVHRSGCEDLYTGQSRDVSNWFISDGELFDFPDDTFLVGDQEEITACGKIHDVDSNIFPASDQR